MALLPPAPVSSPFGSYTWADWYRKVRDTINAATSVAWSIITGTPTTIAGYGITDGATINGTNRVVHGTDTTDDLIVDSATKGLVLKDSAGTPHYWRITISTLGVITITDLGTTKP